MDSRTFSLILLYAEANTQIKREYENNDGEPQEDTTYLYPQEAEFYFKQNISSEFTSVKLMLTPNVDILDINKLSFDEVLNYINSGVDLFNLEAEGLATYEA